jgi:hypothetical protein
MKVILAALLGFVASVLSQNVTNSSSIPMFPCLIESELDKILPVCAQACQQKAVWQDGCEDYDDIACHCSQTFAIGEILGPCLLMNSSCGLNDTNGEFFSLNTAMPVFLTHR